MVRKKTNEEFLEEVSKKTGNEYTFLEEYIDRKTSITVQHNPCGHVFTISPNGFLTHGPGCRKCSKVLKYTDDEYKELIYETRGDEYEVLGSYVSAMEKIEVRHNPCGSQYFIRPSDFKSGVGCNKCSNFGNLRYTTKEFQEELERRYLREFTILEEYKGTSVPVKFRHEVCGSDFVNSPHILLRDGSCRNCTRSSGETKVSLALDTLGIEYEEEKSIGGVLRADFYLPEYGAFIEYDGEQHFRPVEYFGGHETYLKIRFSDDVKNEYCRLLGFKMLRIPYWEKRILEVVRDYIQELEGGRHGGS